MFGQQLRFLAFFVQTLVQSGGLRALLRWWMAQLRWWMAQRAINTGSCASMMICLVPPPKII
jgi:hypothetical protein